MFEFISSPKFYSILAVAIAIYPQFKKIALKTKNKKDDKIVEIIDDYIVPIFDSVEKKDVAGLMKKHNTDNKSLAKKTEGLDLFKEVYREEVGGLADIPVLNIVIDQFSNIAKEDKNLKSMVAGFVKDTLKDALKDTVKKAVKKRSKKK